MCVSFFFDRYGDHRDLHSFPTRRSSDLFDPERKEEEEEDTDGNIKKTIDNRNPSKLRGEGRGGGFPLPPETTAPRPFIIGQTYSGIILALTFESMIHGTEVISTVERSEGKA